MIDSYYTIKKQATGELTEKRSRFIATVLPVETQEQAMRSLLTGSPTRGEAELTIHDALWQCRIGGGQDED